MSDWNDIDYEYDGTQPMSCTGETINQDGLEVYEMIEWAEQVGLMNIIRSREGANFVRKGDAWIIPVTGGQPLHHDRHIADVQDESTGKPLSHDTWNLVVSGEGSQMLLCETAQDMFVHFPLHRGAMIYLNTANRHLVSRTNKDVCVLLQVQGYGPNQQIEALEEMLATWRRETMQKAA